MATQIGSVSTVLFSFEIGAIHFKQPEISLFTSLCCLTDSGFCRALTPSADEKATDDGDDATSYGVAHGWSGKHACGSVVVIVAVGIAPAKKENRGGYGRRHTRAVAHSAVRQQTPKAERPRGATILHEYVKSGHGTQALERT